MKKHFRRASRRFFFISHSWSLPFDVLYEAVREWHYKQPKGGPERFYYVDMIAMNQHKFEGALFIETTSSIITKP